MTSDFSKCFVEFHTDPYTPQPQPGVQCSMLPRRMSWCGGDCVLLYYTKFCPVSVIQGKKVDESVEEDALILVGPFGSVIKCVFVFAY